VHYGVLFQFFVDSNHSHNSNMVKDKYAKALDFMVNMMFTDSCIGYDAREKKCDCLAQFFVEEIRQSDAKNFLAIFLMIFGFALEKMMKTW